MRDCVNVCDHYSVAIPPAILSVYPSVSVTLRYCVETAKHVKIFSRPITVLSF